MKISIDTTFLLSKKQNQLDSQNKTIQAYQKYHWRLSKALHLKAHKRWEELKKIRGFTVKSVKRKHYRLAYTDYFKKEGPSLLKTLPKDRDQK